jgi:hypothetical protein
MGMRREEKRLYKITRLSPTEKGRRTKRVEKGRETCMREKMVSKEAG